MYSWVWIIKWNIGQFNRKKAISYRKNICERGRDRKIILPPIFADTMTNENFAIDISFQIHAWVLILKIANKTKQIEFENITK